MPRTVVAKFLVNRIESTYAGRRVDCDPPQAITYPVIHMTPVHAPEDPKSENGKFWQASPSGSLELRINNPDAAEHFQVGDEFYLTFEKAPVAA